ncbi:MULTISPECIES: 4a-hydroxytetrahydrobiopterin dehydratase [unclassified Aeromicrobium]|jgi:4a-hydroxytetrahydrobiopterin dehydratase|uniref:4a-hydroxytetrahydrobiopterin dehydratase n=1 Tax=unclassified Aeromicrobium TaxID=2633570 RepID=UPI0006F7C38E|nr:MULTISPECIES: 4a-hydroxytetrahydrobiopterin dehydratase [unclassified Aeromicrobium]RYY48438.1 MAG: 4a-hydroxytetrahydrobiopterin dehydratase [Actinomycetales bacterium]KQO41829.1 pterin-4-alpha-carbinolamine dehydratase [Aeromicrobium sp. Leaf245]KQP27162.1 pterin-4-alpha-carbinolamine dehydratase [Aeromicrobium sp. Leaf272]KQP77182.1 pterin-4-alpha-carbinolamine dehydratase [Aeromicrobium sp. Leaf289]KQP81214.1 pterin-4-alpha-carbinolamine dehydratase [Aeromicrobium sp. Leaf291]
MDEPFDPARVTQALEHLPGWSGDVSGLTRTYTFDGFAAAIAFMAAAAPRIDEMDHHPEWTNVYDRVEVRLSSHDVSGVSGRDVRLAEVLDELAGDAAR